MYIGCHDILIESLFVSCITLSPLPWILLSEVWAFQYEDMSVDLYVLKRTFRALFSKIYVEV